MASTASGTLDGTHTVLTPEYVEFKFVLAGLYSRFLAWLLDALVVSAIAVVLILVLQIVMIAFPGFGLALFFIVYFLVNWGYGIALETFWSGQTLGKRALGLRVIQENGVRIGFYHAVIRNLVRVFDQPLPLFYLVGGVAALFSQSHQRLGDMLAGTIVVRERKLKIPASISRPEGETQLLQDPVFLARVAKLSPEEEELIFSAAIRREELGMDARLKLFAALAQHLEQAGFYKPPHLSDEKLVLLVAAAMAAQAKQKKERSRPRRSRP